MQHFQSLVIFRDPALIKINIAKSLQSSAPEWHTFEFSNIDRNVLKNNLGIKNQVNTLFYYFKIPTSIAFGVLIDKIYSFNNARARQTPAQYICAIMQHSIGCNIVNITNQLFFAYRGLAPEFRVFVSFLTKFIRVSNFIHTLKEKQEV